MTNMRNRPYMVISYNYVLKAGQKSQTKGFMETAEWEPVENMVIVDRLTNKLTNRAELILDLLGQKVVKCRDSSLDQVKLFDSFVERHYGEVKAALSKWIANNPENFNMVKDFVTAQLTPDQKLQVVRNAMEQILKTFMFDTNDEDTRGKITEKLSDYLGRQNLEDYSVVCDGDNNTVERVDAHELWVDVAVKWPGDEEFKYIPLRIMPEPVDA